MFPPSTVEPLGQYCGRFNPGIWGEPQNSLSNLAFMAGALWAFGLWRRQPQRDPWQLLLFLLAGFIGVGSFAFHSHPTPQTLTADLVPIQVFGLSAIAYVCLRYLKFTPVRTLAFLLIFFVVRQAWVRSLPFMLGGGITHIPTVLVLLSLGVALRRQGEDLYKYLFAASLAYVAALAVRTLDLPLCAAFPIGLHWCWHLLTAAAAGMIVQGLARHQPVQTREPRTEPATYQAPT
jgi:hypothetical protein